MNATEPPINVKLYMQAGLYLSEIGVLRVGQSNFAPGLPLPRFGAKGVLRWKCLQIIWKMMNSGSAKTETFHVCQYWKNQWLQWG